MELLKPSTVRRGLKGAALWLLLMFAVPGTSAQTAAGGDREYAVKAVFLYNFCQFIDWPAGSFVHDKAPIIIGVLGGNPFGSLLGETVQGEVIRGRPIQLEFYQKPQDTANCHILFVSDAAMARFPSVIGALKGRGVVTVGESEVFLDQGGMIALPSVQNKIRLRINLGNVRAEKIEMSSKLLRVADIKR